MRHPLYTHAHTYTTSGGATDLKVGGPKFASEASKIFLGLDPLTFGLDPQKWGGGPSKSEGVQTKKMYSLQKEGVLVLGSELVG